MAENTTIARPYAEAAFALADAGGALARWAQALDVMAEVAAHPEVRAAIGNPRVTGEQAYGLFASLSGDSLASDVQKFLRVLIENGRLEVLPEVHELFQELKNEREGVVDAEVTSAFELDPAQMSELVAHLERRFRKKVSPVVTVDKGLIGGVRVKVGDEVIDSTVRAHLAAMEAALKR
jgi:F-type H+-transporting ATPase subunit delta